MLEVRLFGKFEVRLNDQFVEISSRAGQSLLAYLLLNAGQSHRREKLAGLFWPDSLETSARNNLRQTLWQLGKVIGKEYFVTDRVSVAFKSDADYQLDADILQTEVDATTSADQLIRIVSVYEGRLLPGFYDDWIILEQERLQAIFEDRVQMLLDRLAEEARWREAREWAERWISRGQKPEPAYRSLMLAHAGLGDRAGIAAAYQRCIKALEEALGVEPSPETLALYQRLMNSAEPSSEKMSLSELAPASDPPLQAAPAIRPPRFLEETSESSPASQEVFIGRENELSRLDQFLAQALTGQGQIALVIGEAGQGKTSLLNAFTRQALEDHPELIIARGTCNVYTGSGDPYLPFREIMSMLSGNIESQRNAGALSRDHALRLWNLLPYTVQALVDHGQDLIDSFVDAEKVKKHTKNYVSEEAHWLKRFNELIDRRANLDDQISDQDRIFEGYTGVLSALADRQPLLILLDDLHWADLSSISLLSHLIHRIAEIPILLVGAYRPEEVTQGRDGQGHPLADLLSEIKRRFGDIWIDLEVNEKTAGQAFVDALLDIEPNQLGETFREQFLHHTGAQPLFTVELLRDMQIRGDLQKDDQGRWIESPDLSWDTLPARVEGVIEKRLSHLDDTLKEVLSVASVEGEEFTAEVIARVLAKDEREMVKRLSGELEKKHHLITAQGIRRLEPGEQRLSSYRFRHNLFRSYIYQNMDEVEQSYWHEAIGNALEQMHAQKLEGVVVQLARHFEKAGLASKAIEYWMQAGNAAARVYANAEAIASYRRALALTRQHDASSEVLTQLYTGLGRAFELTNQFDQALRKYRELEELAQHRNNLTLELTALMAQITLHAVPGPLHDPTRGQALGEKALTLANDLGHQAAEAKILWNLLLVNIYNNNMPQAIAYGERSLTLSRQLNLREQMAFTLNDIASCYWVLGRFDQAKEAVKEAQSLWREFGNRPMLADSLHISTQINIRIGEYDQAIERSEEAYQISLSDNNLWGQSSSRFRLGYVYLERGQIDKAITIMEDTIRQSEQAGFLVPPIVTRTELAAVYGSLGEIERGLELVRLALSIAGEHMPLYQTFVLGHLAQLLLLNDNLEEAEKTIDRARDDPGRDAWPVYYLPVRFADSWLAFKMGDYEQALAKTDKLLAIIRQYGMRSELPGILNLQSQVLLGMGQNDTARKRLIEARTEAESLGSRRTLWQILKALSRLESDPSNAEKMQRQSQEIIEYIANNIDNGKLRTSFLELSQKFP